MPTYKRKLGKPLKLNINVDYDGKRIDKLSNKSFSDEIIAVKEIDATDTGVQLISFNDGSFLANSLKDSKGMVLCNQGNVSAELVFATATWTHGTPGTPDVHASSAGQKQHVLLHPGEFYVLPNLYSLHFSTIANSAALGDNDALNNTAPNTNLYVDSVANTAEALDASETGVDVDDLGYFEVGDLIQVESEIMEVTAKASDDGAGALTVVRGVYGSIGASHSNPSDIRYPFFNAYYDFDKALQGSSQLVQTDGAGRFKCFNFFGFCRNAGDPTQTSSGLVPGSVAIKFYEKAYQDVAFGFEVNQSTASKLTASTAYAFDLTIDDSSATTVSFTTDSNNLNLGNVNGIIQKIQDAVTTATRTSGGGLFGYSCTVSVIDGQLRFTSNSHLLPHDGTNGSKVLLATASSGTDLFSGSAGIFPAIANVAAAKIPVLPDDNITDPVTNSTYPNDSAFLYDDGQGNLQGVGSGTINYHTGAIDFIAPNHVNGSFVINAHYDSAFSGKLKTGGNNYDNAISSVTGRSTNSKINTKIAIYAFN